MIWWFIAAGLALAALGGQKTNASIGVVPATPGGAHPPGETAGGRTLDADGTVVWHKGEDPEFLVADGGYWRAAVKGGRCPVAARGKILVLEDGTRLQCDFDTYTQQDKWKAI